MNTIIITGANGFSGSHVLESFIERPNQDYRMIAACRSVSKLPDGYSGEAIIGDLRDRQYLEEISTKADVICHTAAWAELNGTAENSRKNFLEPTIQLIDTALRKGVKKFIFLSAITSNPIEQNSIRSKRALSKIWPHYDSIINIEKYLKKISGQGMQVVILRAGFFVGKNYSIGILPVLLPRLKSRLVPWIRQGKTTLPFVDGQDLGLAFRLSSTVELKDNLNVIDIVGYEIPTVRDVLQYLHHQYKYPLPLFSVGFGFAYLFARIMRSVHKIFPGDPLIVPAIVLLLEETNASNTTARKLLGYTPSIHWKESIDAQIEEMGIRQKEKMKLNKPSL